RPVFEDKEPRDPLLSLLPPCDWDAHKIFKPSVWGPQAFIKSFEKFFYATPSNFEKDYPDLCEFADWAVKKEFSFLRESRVIDIRATDKNVSSTPAYPKMMLWDTEEEYLEERGFDEYVKEFERIYDITKSKKIAECPRVLWYLFLKKEILKVSKIEDNDIRQIVCADPCYVRIGACFEQHQNSMMKHQTEHKWGQCGWCPMEGGFKRRMERLDNGNAYFIEFDWTRFDGTIPTQLFRRIKKLRWSFINKEQREYYSRMYEWYCYNLFNRYVLLPSGEVTEQTRGNPSGQFSTTMDNNMVNVWLQAFEFAYFFGPDKKKWSKVDALIYGDDRLSSWPEIPVNYGERVVEMYKKVFGMWVKPEKVKVQNTLVGLSFCGFTVDQNYEPVPSSPEKLLAGLLTPTKKMPDLESLHGKLLCFQLLSAFLPEDHPFKNYVEMSLASTAKQLPGTALPPRFTEEQLHCIWRGGPKICNG
ncbi:RNA-dependent RNA polymerase, partial [Bottlenose dolphin astrovirus 1]